MVRKPVYLCDPQKNTECKKTTCKTNLKAKYRVCELTSKVAYALRDENGEPIETKGEWVLQS